MARAETGFFKLHRKVLHSDIGQNYLLLGLWVTLLKWANWRDSKITWRGLPRTLGRGEILTSVKELAQYGDVHRRTVDKWLKYLCLRGSISIEKAPQGSRDGIIVTVINYKKYQSLDAVWSHEHGNEHASEDASEHASEDRTYEELKNKRKKEYRSHSLWPLFEEFVREYPIKIQAGESGFKRFLDHVKDDSDFAKVMTHLGHYKTHLSKNEWKAPKQTAETWFGTAKTGFYWQQWDSADAGDSKLKKASGMPDIVEE